MIGVFLHGQLGNHLFNYSFLRIVASHRGYESGVIKNPVVTDELDPHEWYADGIFDISPSVYDATLFTTNYCDTNSYGDCLHIRPHDISHIMDFTTLCGIFQGSDVISKIDPNWFPVKSLPFIKGLEDQCIIHFRGQDYKRKTFQPNPALLPDIGLYYEDAKNLIRDMTGKNLRFVVVTDDIEFAKANVVADEYVQNNMASDFRLLYDASYTIIPNSTFSWWASFLSPKRKICVAPSGWFFYRHQQKIQTNWCYTDKFTWM